MARNKLVSSSSLTSAAHLSVVTPHVSNELPDGPCRALYVGGGGDLVVVAEDDTQAVTLAGVAGGTLLPIRAKAVRASSTATGIVALY